MNRDMVPVGYHFAPWDTEIIESYLRKLVKGEAMLPSQAVVKKDIYGAAPWEVFNDQDPWIYGSVDNLEEYSKKNNIKIIYFYTQVQYKKGNVARKAGCGTWAIKTTAKKIVSREDGKVIGYKKMLTYLVKGEDEDKINMIKAQHGHWNMHEYTLDDSYKSDYVMCKITQYFEPMSFRNDRIRKLPSPSCATKKMKIGSCSTSTKNDHPEELQLVCSTTSAITSTYDTEWFQGMERRLVEDGTWESSDVNEEYAANRLYEYGSSLTNNYHELQTTQFSSAGYANGGNIVMPTSTKNDHFEGFTSATTSTYDIEDGTWESSDVNEEYSGCANGSSLTNNHELQSTQTSSAAVCANGKENMQYPLDIEPLQQHPGVATPQEFNVDTYYDGLDDLIDVSEYI